MRKKESEPKASKRKVLTQLAKDKLAQILRVDEETPWVKITLGECRRRLAVRLHVTGVNSLCPLCQQNVQSYARRLNNIARVLVAWYLRWPDREFHLLNELYAAEPKLLNFARGGDFSKLRWWGLIEAKPRKPGEKKATGYYRLTATAIRFILNEIDRPSHVLVYANHKLDDWTETTTITEAIGIVFDHEDVMALHEASEPL